MLCLEKTLPRSEGITRHDPGLRFSKEIPIDTNDYFETPTIRLRRIKPGYLFF